MFRTKVVVALAATLAATASWCSTAPVSAQSGEPEPAGPEPVVIEESVPVDPGDPAAEDAAPVALGDVEELVEVESERTEDSRTYVAPDGTYQSVIAADPINYEDDAGDFQEIDNELVPETGADEGWHNAANAFDVEVPATLDDPIVVSDAGASISFALVAPPATAGEAAPDAVDPAEAEGEPADDGSVSYDIGGGVSLRYTAQSTGLKEEIVLATPEAARSVAFDVTVTGGELRQLAGGDLAVVGPDGKVRITVPAPFAIDDRLEEGPAHAQLDATATGHRLTVTGDDAWLDAPGRSWPVVIDPTVSFQGTTESTDCFIASAASSVSLRDCGSSYLRVGYEAGVQRRSLLEFPNIETIIPRNSERVTAQLRMMPYQSSNPSGTTEIGVFKVTKDWTTQLNWNNADTGVTWASAGGDYDSTTPEYVDAAGQTKTFPNTQTSVVNFYVHEIVNSWLARPATNNGLILVANPFTTSNMVNFRSAEHTTAADQPALWVGWKYREGISDEASFERFDTTDRSSFSLNYANLNGVVAANEFDIQGTGHNLEVSRFYNTREATRRWTWSIGRDTHLAISGDQSVELRTASGQRHLFIKKAAGGYFDPPGLNAKLTQDSGTQYTLTYNRSQMELQFQKKGDMFVPTRLRDRNDNDITYAYTLNGTLPEIDTVTDTQDRVMDVTWTAGKITEIADWRGRIASYTWDGDLLTVARDAANADTTYGYDGNDRLETITTAEDRLLTIGYSTTTDRITSVTRRRDSGTSFTWSVEWFGTQQRTRITDPNSHTVDYYWTYREKISKIVDGLAHTTSQKTFNNNDDATEFKNAGSQVWQYGYSSDGNNNLETIQSPSAGTSGTLTNKLSYDTGSGVAGGAYLASDLIDSENNCRAFSHDSRGNVTHTYDGRSVTSGSCASSGGALTETPRNPDGTIDYVRDPNGTTINYIYDTAGNLQQIVPPAPLNPTVYTVDDVSRVINTKDGNYKDVGFTYDNMDRIVEITYEATSCTSTSSCTTFDYDDDGNLVERVDSSGTTTFTYDGLGRLRSETQPGGANACSTGGSAVTLDYDGFGNLTSYCDAEGPITYSFDAANRMTGLAEPGGTCTTPRSACTVYGYDNDSRLRTITYPTTTAYTVEYEYGRGGQVTGVTGTKGNGTPSVDLTYSYLDGSSETAQVRTRTNSVLGQVRSYGYDSRDRLCWTKVAGSASSGSCTSPPSASDRYAYDANGNRTRHTDTAGNVTTLKYNTANELCWTAGGTPANACASPPSGAETSSWDHAGNLTGRSDGFSATYNDKNHTSSVTHPGQAARSMTYADVDQTERLTYGSTTFSSGPLGQTRMEYSSGTVVAWTRTNDGMLHSQKRSAAPTGRHYYVLDRQGSVVGLVSPAGDLVNDYEYHPFGKLDPSTTETVDNRYRFHGGFMDEGTDRSIKFGTRYYDQKTGRFTQADPLIGSVTDPTTASRYHYANSNPANASDPTGYDECGEDWNVGGLVDCGAQAAENAEENLSDDDCADAMIDYGISSAGLIAGTASAAAAPNPGTVSLAAISAAQWGRSTSEAAEQCG